MKRRWQEIKDWRERSEELEKENAMLRADLSAFEVLTQKVSIDPHAWETAALDIEKAARRKIANSIAMALVERGFIQFESYKERDDSGRYYGEKPVRIEGTLVVVAPANAGKLKNLTLSRMQQAPSSDADDWELEEFALRHVKDNAQLSRRLADDGSVVFRFMLHEPLVSAWDDVGAMSNVKAVSINTVTAEVRRRADGRNYARVISR